MLRKIRPMAISNHELVQLPVGFMFGEGEPLVDIVREQIVLVTGLSISGFCKSAPVFFNDVAELLPYALIAMLIHADLPYIGQVSMCAVCSY